LSTRVSDQEPRRGQIWQLRHPKGVALEDLDLFKAVVVSPDRLLSVPWRIVVPLIPWDEEFALHPWVVPLEASTRSGLQVRAAADALRVRGLRLNRFIRPVGYLDSSVMEDLAAAVALCVGHPGPD